MTNLSALETLRDFVETELADFKLESKSGELKSPAVYEGYLPAKPTERNKQQDEDDFYPYVIVRFTNNKDALHGDNIADFRLIIGVYNQDEQHGWKDAVSVMDRLKFRFREVQNIGPNTLYGEIDMGLFEVQKKPYWHSVMDLSLKLPPIKWGRSVLDDF